jgi:hypothetical protein
LIYLSKKAKCFDDLDKAAPMNNQDAQIKLKELKQAYQRNINAFYKKSEEYGIELQLKIEEIKSRQKRELDDLNKKYDFKSQNSESGIFQLQKFHKKEMETFIKEYETSDPKFRMKLIAMKIQHKTELAGFKRGLEGKISELSILHKAELDELNIKADSEIQLSRPISFQMSIRYDLECRAVLESFMYANKKYKVGDVLSDQDRTISVRWFSSGNRWLWHMWEEQDDSLDVSYRGYLLDKNGKLRADGAKATIWQSDVIE